jgi:hypothetical protein
LPNIDHFLELIEIYTERDFSNPDDALAAFSAIIIIQGRTTMGGVLYGASELIFSIMLLWETSSPPLNRRTGANGMVSKKLPSCSWTVWTESTYQVHSQFVPSKRFWKLFCLTHIHMLEFYKTFAVPRLEARVRVRQAHSHQLNSIEQR